MKILVALTYYRPHISGLTIYVERAARALAARGHEVLVLTSRYDRRLPLEEVRDGVRIRRVPVLMRVSKGVIMPTIGWWATRLARWADVLWLHLPQFDAAGIALRGRLFRKPVVLTYHCDVTLPPGWLNRVANQVVHLMDHLAARLADVIVSYTEDYARHSPYLSRYLAKVRVIPPPVEIPVPDPERVAAFRARWGLEGHVVIGMAARLAAEKGVEYLLEALPHILAVYPNARVLFAGPYRNVLGEEAYARRLAPLFERYRDHWTFVGVLEPEEMAAFYASCDVVVLPSWNATESFGLVQVEAMLCGTPVVASDLPGVRVPTQTTGMGLTFPPRDSRALAQAILRVLAERPAFCRPREWVAQHYNTERTAAAYEALFEELRASRDRKKKGD
ncbi:MAG: glycosyltransferase family 4 protein [Thermoflexus sp.]|jgi:glycosyltransferase involved in cell wall biosynthesis|uniref:glycosyltransferase family 4 protein n=1 Tax=Thermoflexus sp. TaxID=1969742 RepID=UPI00261A02D1|nr:glycosyltransferase family 4 protein [Thermoflexus sp.]MDT7885319.1 glycosyltransferase family 4 protein [Thermoflexus sp.]MDT7949272.1 glycosyltransferase family 4 protein [Thermoflexus sp.]